MPVNMLPHCCTVGSWRISAPRSQDITAEPGSGLQHKVKRAKGGAVGPGLLLRMTKEVAQSQQAARREVFIRGHLSPGLDSGRTGLGP